MIDEVNKEKRWGKWIVVDCLRENDCKKQLEL